ncbi:MAG: UbiX family flavin prenyltransferase [Sphingomonadales bacterium]|jgi:4-hydroxy-3-polyprenylbenzoate decarboxylase
MKTQRQNAKDKPPRLIIGISGASGVIYGVRLLEILRDTPVETHLVISKAAEMTLASETDLKSKDVMALADKCYPVGHVGAAIASGSFPAHGMIIAPCSIRTLGEIVTGVTTSLLTRAADVTLKERRPLVLMVRETPLHTGHLRSMTAASEIGAIIAPPMPAFYTRPQNLDEMITQSVARLLDVVKLDLGDAAQPKRWGIDVDFKEP